MAIKERKQITGTEAQIKGYAGHNGVLAYATDTKHLHVLSGTAGTTTKLANMSDTTALTEDLKKKENAGVCLPLTGGVLTGPLYLTETNHLWAVVEEEYKGVELGGGSTFKNGAALFLRNNNATGTGESGQWGLAAHKVGSDKESLLIGSTDNLHFNGKEVERFEGFYTTQFTGGFCDVHRYVTGLQIVTAAITIPASKKRATLTFTKPFISATYSITTSSLYYPSNTHISWDALETTGVSFCRRDYADDYSFDLYITCAFIGRWL